MKKVLFILAVAFAGFAASCNNATETEENKDSVVVEEVAPAADTTVADSTIVE